MKSVWRAIALLTILAASIIAGLWWHGKSSPGEALNPAAFSTPFLIGIYVTDPTVQVAVRVDVYKNNDIEEFADLYVSPPTTGTVLVTSTVEDTNISSDGSLHDPYFSALPEDQWNNPNGYHFYETMDPVSNPPLTFDQRGYMIGTFRLSENNYLNTDQEIREQMPIIGAYEVGTQYNPPAASLDNSGLSLFVSPKPNITTGSRTPSDFVIDSPVNVSAQDLYWEPQNLAVTEVLDGVGDQVKDWDVITSPSGGAPNAMDYVWHGSFSMDATMTATDRSIEEQRRTYEFYSGIALATGAAALIALFQEGKDSLEEMSWVQRGRRRREIAPKPEGPPILW